MRRTDKAGRSNDSWRFSLVTLCVTPDLCQMRTGVTQSVTYENCYLQHTSKNRCYTRQAGIRSIPHI